MEAYVTAAAELVLAKLKATPSHRRVLVGIAGVPGSGKSTLAYPLVDRLNALLGVYVKGPAEVDLEDVVAAPGKEKSEDEVAIAVGLDGWHHTREELDRFGCTCLCADPVEARRRRGAVHFRYVSFIRSPRTDPVVPAVPFPTFSHALKDPAPSPFPILPTHRIVVVEGLYALLDVEPWREATDELDVKIWVDCDRAVARRRLIRRYLQSGIEPSKEAAEQRVDLSDIINGDIDDPAFAIATTH
ncbi:hypothetical protein JCM1841_005396 [Sporobolomyces salmonicolor]